MRSYLLPACAWLWNLHARIFFSMPVTFSPLVPPRRILYLLNPVHQSVVPCCVSVLETSVSIASSVWLCSLHHPLKGAGWTPSMLIWQDLATLVDSWSTPISPTALCSHLIIARVLPRLRSGSLTYNFLSTPMLKSQLGIFASGLGIDLKGNILWETTLGDGIKADLCYKLRMLLPNFLPSVSQTFSFMLSRHSSHACILKWRHEITHMLLEMHFPPSQFVPVTVMEIYIKIYVSVLVFGFSMPPTIPSAGIFCLLTSHLSAMLWVLPAT